MQEGLMEILEGAHGCSLDFSLLAHLFSQPSCRLYEYNSSFPLAILSLIPQRIAMIGILLVQGLFIFGWARDSNPKAIPKAIKVDLPYSYLVSLIFFLYCSPSSHPYFSPIS